MQTNRTLLALGIGEILLGVVLIGGRYHNPIPIGATLLFLSLALVSGLGCGMRYARGEWGIGRIVRFGILWPIVTAILVGVSLAAVVHYSDIQPSIALAAIMSEIVFVTGVLSRTRGTATAS